MKREAKRNRRSVNAEIVQVLADRVEEAERRQRLRAMSEELQRFRASLPMLSDSTPIIRRDRERP